MFGRGREKRLTEIEQRLARVEDDSKTTKAIRRARADRRDWYLTKLIPTISAVVISVLSLNAVFHWI